VQLRHGAEPFDILKVPVMHAEHAPPSSPEYPGSHVHFMMPLLPSPELEPDGHSVHIHSEAAAMLSLYFPRGQDWQGADPFSALKDPAMQATHVCPSGPVKPTLQVQFTMLKLPVPDSVCKGHTLHIV
jgi:hypothetical protein